MTEAEWLACDDPYAMLEWLHNSGKADRRKFGLILAACCKRIKPWISEDRSRWTEYTDGDDDTCDPIALTGAKFHLFLAATEAIHAIGNGKCERLALTSLLRDVIGPLPFRAVAIEKSCLTPYVLAIAKGVYEDRAYYRLPSLADALEEAGCTDADILGHLRGVGPHVRGCWVVDLCLGKS